MSISGADEKFLQILKSSKATEDSMDTDGVSMNTEKKVIHLRSADSYLKAIANMNVDELLMEFKALDNVIMHLGGDSAYAQQD